MVVPRFDQLNIESRPRLTPTGSRLWREWCFARVAFRHFRTRFLIMVGVVTIGAILFMIYEGHAPMTAVFYTWSLVLGEPPEEFPRVLALKLLFFIIPVLGLTVIVEGIIDFALMVRDRRRYERSWCTMLASSYHDHIVLVGFGRLGFRSFKLLRRMGAAVVVIEKDEQNEFLEVLRRDGSPLLIGDARRDVLLADANVRKARSIILATDDDLANLETALDARRLNPNIRVVMRMFDQNMADKIGSGFGLEVAMSQSAISAPAFATAAIQPSIVNSFVVDDRLVVMQRWLVRRGGPLAGRTVGEAIAELRVNIVEHLPVGGTTTLFPTPETRLEAGDGLVVQGTYETIADLSPRVMGVQEAEAS